MDFYFALMTLPLTTLKIDGRSRPVSRAPLTSLVTLSRQSKLRGSDWWAPAACFPEDGPRLPVRGGVSLVFSGTRGGSGKKFTL